MTCIVALVDDGYVCMMGDSLVTGEDGEAEPRKIQKVFTVGEFLIGFSGYLKTGQIVKHNLKVPAKPSRQASVKYMSTVFVDSLEKCLRAGNALSLNKGDTNMRGYLLVGYNGAIYSVGTDLEINRSPLNYDAIGQAAGIAKGSLFSTEDFGLLPRHRLRLALLAAEKFSSVVRRPFIYKEL